MPTDNALLDSDEISRKVSPTENDIDEWREAHERIASETALDIYLAQARLARAQADETEDLIKYRTRFSRYFLSIYFVWIVLVTILLFLRGFNHNFNLSDFVMSFLLGSFTVTILTPAIVLARYLFGTNRKNTPDQRSHT